MAEEGSAKDFIGALAARQGLPLAPGQLSDLVRGYAYLEAMARRVRGREPRSHAAEPAAIFRPLRPAP